MDVGIVAVAWVAGTGTIGKTSVQSLLQSLSPGSHTTRLIWHAWKWANAQERQRKPQPAEPWSYLWQIRNQKMYHSNIFWHVFIQQVFSLLALGQYFGTKHELSKKISRSDAKSRNLFHCPGESSSLNILLLLSNGHLPIGTQSISVKKKKKKNCRCSVTYTL